MTSKSLWNFSKQTLYELYPDTKKSYLCDDLLIFTTKFLCDMKKTWYDNGMIQTQCFYLNNKKHRVSKVWNLNGDLISHISYVNGEKHGLCKELNKELSDNYIFHGASKHWYCNGNIEKYDNYYYGLRSGESIWYWKNGNIQWKDFYMDGNQHGESTQWYSSGKIKSRYFYRHGVKYNVEKFDVNGNIIYQQNFDNNISVKN